MTNPLSTTGRSAPGPVHPLALAAERYPTDGRGLFRVVSPRVPGTDRVLVSLENRLTIEVAACTRGERCALGLRLARTAA